MNEAQSLVLEHIVINSPSIGPNYGGHPPGEWRSDCPMCARQPEQPKPSADVVDVIAEAVGKVFHEWFQSPLRREGDELDLRPTIRAALSAATASVGEGDVERVARAIDELEWLSGYIDDLYDKSPEHYWLSRIRDHLAALTPAKVDDDGGR